MKLSEKVLTIFSFIFLLSAIVVPRIDLINTLDKNTLQGILLASALIAGIGYLYRGVLLTCIGLIFLATFNFLLGSIVIIVGFVLLFIEKKELKEDIREVYRAKYKKDPEKVDVVFFSLSFNLKERKKRFNTYFTPHIKNAKIQTNGKIQKFFYDDEYRILYKRE